MKAPVHPKANKQSRKNEQHANNTSIGERVKVGLFKTSC